MKFDYTCKVCPHYGHDEVSRNGKYNRKQTYICKSCKRTFTDFTLSPKHNSKKDVKQWIQYAKCMINGYSIRKCAEEVKISIPTSFYWRHKILDAIRAFMSIGSVGGVVEVDEAFHSKLKKRMGYIKRKNLLVQSHTSYTDTKLKDFRGREAIYV